jgi:hypothetical protein
MVHAASRSAIVFSRTMVAFAMISFSAERTSRMRRAGRQEASEQETTRRTILRAAAGTTAALGAALTAGAASAAPRPGGQLPYPADVTDASHATREVAVELAAEAPLS